MVTSGVVLELVVEGWRAPHLVLAWELGGGRTLARTPRALMSMGRGASFGKNCSRARDVELVTTWHKLQHLAIEKVLTHLSGTFHVADSDILQLFISAKNLFCSHNFGFHVTGLQFDQNCAKALTLCAIFGLETFPYDFDHCLFRVDSFSVDFLNHFLHSVKITNFIPLKVLEGYAQRHSTVVLVANFILKGFYSITVLTNVSFDCLELCLKAANCGKNVLHHCKHGSAEITFIDWLPCIELGDHGVHGGDVNPGQLGHGRKRVGGEASRRST